MTGKQHKGILEVMKMENVPKPNKDIFVKINKV